MALDWAVYDAFRSRPRVDQEIQAKRENLQYATAMSGMVKEQQQKQQQASDFLLAQRDNYDQLSGLQRDKEALVSLINDQEKKITEGVAKSNGDPYRYLNSGGMGELRKFHANIKSSDELNRLINHREIMSMNYEALKDGKAPIPAVIDVNGQAEPVSVSQQIELYNQGKLDSIQWNGAEKPIELDPVDFLKISNPDDPNKSRPLTTEEVYGFLIAKGQNPLLARQRALQDADGKGNSRSLKFGVDERLRAMYAKDRLQRTSSKNTYNVWEDAQLGRLNSRDFIYAEYMKDGKPAGKNALSENEPLSYTGYKNVVFPTGTPAAKLFKDTFTEVDPETKDRYLDVRRGERFGIMGSDEDVITNEAAEGRYRVKNIDLVSKEFGTKKINAFGSPEDVKEGNVLYARVTLEKPDEDVLKEGFKFEKSGKGIWEDVFLVPSFLEEPTEKARAAFDKNERYMTILKPVTGREMELMEGLMTSDQETQISPYSANNIFSGRLY